ncbi:MAG: hypothetical protein ACI89L_000878 [Phycisphaerales bacterium]|jgi:hypothetical protein
MKNASAIQTPFRLVGRAHQPWDDAADHAKRCPQLLQPYDPRWVFAVRAAEAVTRADNAMLGEDSRERLIRQASGMGLSRFDALGVIAIVAGEAAAGRHPLGSETEYRLTHVPTPAQACNERTCGVPIALAIALTAAVMALFTYGVLTL